MRKTANYIDIGVILSVMENNNNNYKRINKTPSLLLYLSVSLKRCENLMDFIKLN